MLITIGGAPPLPLPIAGLPAHPLLVHAVVVLVPLAALGSILVAARTAWRRPYAPLVAVLAVIAALATTAAKIAGDQLAAFLTAQGQDAAPINAHGQFGTFTLVAVWPYAVLAVVAAVLARRSVAAPTPVGTGPAPTATSSTAATLTAWLAALVGLVAIALTVLTGDSGARMVWGFVFES